MKHFLFKFILAISTIFLSNQLVGQNIQVLNSTALLTTTPLECQDVIYRVDLQLGCINYSHMGNTYSVSGTTITININYSSLSICLGAISTPSHTVNIGKINSGSYTVVINGVEGSTVLHTYTTSLNIGSCCGPTAAFSPSAASYCVGDTFVLSNTSSAYKSQLWFYGSTLLDSSKHLTQVTTQSGTINYTLVAIDSCGTDTTTKSIKVLPNLSLGNDTNICLNDQIQKVAPLGWSSYKWSTTNSTRIQTISSTGNYILTVTAASGCRQTDSIKVNAVGPLLDLGQDRLICPNDSITITAGNNLWNRISWNNGDTTATINISKPGTYVANVFNSIGCNFFDAITINLDKDSVVNILGADTVCVGDSVTLSAGPNFKNYLWGTGDTNSSIKSGVTGRFTLTAISQAGCTVYDTAYIGHNPKPTISLGNDTILCTGKNWLIDASRPGLTGFRWQDASRKNTFNINRKGKYFVAVTDTNGCRGSDTIVVDYKDCETTDPGDTTKTALNEFSNASQIAIFPNPTSDMLTIRMNNHLNILSVKLFDVNGRTILAESGLKEQEITLDLSVQTNGTYIIQLETEQEFFRSIIVVQ